MIPWSTVSNATDRLMAQRFIISCFSKDVKISLCKRGGQFHNYDLPYMHLDVLVWYYSYHYGLVFALLLPIQWAWRLRGDLIQVYSFWICTQVLVSSTCGLTTAFFHVIGKVPVESDLLMMFPISGTRASAADLRREPGIGSSSHDFWLDLHIRS